VPEGTIWKLLGQGNSPGKGIPPHQVQPFTPFPCPNSPSVWTSPGPKIPIRFTATVH
ncbi:hypothetical protein P7K49_003043, partial [Saguinus oedipus]